MYIACSRNGQGETVDVGDELSLGFARVVRLTKRPRNRFNNVTAVRLIGDAAQNDTACNSLLFHAPKRNALPVYALNCPVDSRVDDPLS